METIETTWKFQIYHLSCNVYERKCRRDNSDQFVKTPWKGFITTAGSCLLCVVVLLLVIPHIEPQQKPQGITHEFNQSPSAYHYQRQRTTTELANETKNRNCGSDKSFPLLYPPTMNESGLLVFFLELLKYTRQTSNTRKSREEFSKPISSCVNTILDRQGCIVGPCRRVSLDQLMERLERLCPLLLNMLMLI